MDKNVDYLIIGGGPSGLSLANKLKGKTLILEKENEVGGLCRSIEIDEGVFDIGGHSFHTPHPEVNELVSNILEDGIFKQKREARVFTNGQLIDYPFQKNYEQISNKNIVAICEKGLNEIKNVESEPENFEEYIINKFGSGISDHFMLPYNRKLWARDIKSISCEWTSERVADVKGKNEAFQTSSGKRKPLQSDTKVGYPSRGGFQEIFRGFEKTNPNIILNSEVVSIDTNKKIAKIIDGTEYKYKTLISTIPLPILVRIIKGCDKHIIKEADSLEYMSLRVAFLLVGKKLNSDVQRIYISNPEIYAHKIALNHNSSDFLRKKNQSAIMAEVSLSDEKKINPDDIPSNTIDFLCKIGILESREDVILEDFVDVKYAYPVYTHDRPRSVKLIKSWMKDRSIYTLGRFGEWEYINSDKCIMKGIQLAKELNN